MTVPVSGLVRATSTMPEAWAGVVAVMEVALVNVTLEAEVPPKVTVGVLMKLVPVIVTEVPPEGEP